MDKIADDYSEDDIALGTRWSIVFALSMATMIFYTVNSALLICGAHNLKARMTAMGCSCCVQSLLLACIMTVGCFRFNTIGQLGALSEAPCEYNSDWQNDGMLVTDDRTLNQDGALITWLWSLMIVFCCCKCCLTGYIQKPPGPEAMMAGMQGMAEQMNMHHDA